MAVLVTQHLSWGLWNDGEKVRHRFVKASVAWCVVAAKLKLT